MPSSLRNAGSASTCRQNAGRPDARTTCMKVGDDVGEDGAPRCNSAYHRRYCVSSCWVSMAACARIVRVSATLALSFASSALPRSVAVDSKDFLFASSALERHSAATNVDATRPRTSDQPSDQRRAGASLTVGDRTARRHLSTPRSCPAPRLAGEPPRADQLASPIINSTEFRQDSLILADILQQIGL